MQEGGLDLDLSKHEDWITHLEVCIDTTRDGAASEESDDDEPVSMVSSLVLAFAASFGVAFASAVPFSFALAFPDAFSFAHSFAFSFPCSCRFCTVDGRTHSPGEARPGNSRRRHLVGCCDKEAGAANRWPRQRKAREHHCRDATHLRPCHPSSMPSWACSTTTECVAGASSPTT